MLRFVNMLLDGRVSGKDIKEFASRGYSRLLESVSHVTEGSEKVSDWRHRRKDGSISTLRSPLTR